MSKNNLSFEAQSAQNFHVARGSFLKLKTKRRYEFDEERSTKVTETLSLRSVQQDTCTPG
jgi:hypothetical protein